MPAVDFGFYFYFLLSQLPLFFFSTICSLTFVAIICKGKLANRIELLTIPAIVLKSMNTPIYTDIYGKKKNSAVYTHICTNILTYGFIIIFTIALFNIDLSKTQRTLTHPLYSFFAHTNVHKKNYM